MTEPGQEEIFYTITTIYARILEPRELRESALEALWLLLVSFALASLSFEDRISLDLEKSENHVSSPFAISPLFRIFLLSGLRQKVLSKIAIFGQRLSSGRTSQANCFSIAQNARKSKEEELRRRRWIQKPTKFLLFSVSVNGSSSPRTLPGLTNVIS